MKKGMKWVLTVILLIAVVAAGVFGYMSSKELNWQMVLHGNNLLKEDQLVYTFVNKSYFPLQLREILVLEVYDESGKPVQAGGSAYAPSAVDIPELEEAGRKAVQDHQVIYVTEYAVGEGKGKSRQEGNNTYNVQYTLNVDEGRTVHAAVILQGRRGDADNWQDLYSSSDTIGDAAIPVQQPAVPRLTHSVSYDWSVKGENAYLEGLGTIPEREILIPAQVWLRQTENGYVYDPLDGQMYPVMVGDGSLSGTDIREVTFTEGVLIENNSMGNKKTGFFQNCGELIAVYNIPKTVTSMVNTFKDCTAMQKMPEIPDSVAALKYTFAGCTALEDVSELPEQLTIMDGCFEGCTALRAAPVIPSKVTSLADTFKNCTALVESPVLPGGVVQMSNCFMGCSALVEMPDLPETVTYFSGCFEKCVALTKTGELPDSIENMRGAFRGCTNLVEVTDFPAAAEDMRSSFENCSNLRTIPEFPDCAANFSNCFKGCSALTGEIEIPTGASNSEQYYRNLKNAFAGCEKLNGFIVHTCENSDIKIVLPEDVKITFMQDHTAEGMCPSCGYVTDSYEVDGLDVYMENVPEGIVNQVLEFLDNGIPDKMKNTCRKLTFTQNLGKYNAKYSGRQWNGFAMYPSGDAYVLVQIEGDRFLDNLDIELEFLMREQATGICSTIAHELGHCYDANFTTSFRYSNSAEWKRLCEEEGDVHIEQLEENYSTNEYNREMFARSIEAYFLKEYFETDFIPYINCVGMIDYVSSLLEDAA